jgi:hypothetical protein
VAEKALIVLNIVKKEPATWFKWIGGVLNVLLFLPIFGSAIFPSISGDKVSLRQIQTSDLNASGQSPLNKTKKQYNCLSNSILLKLLTCRRTKLNLNLDL